MVAVAAARSASVLRDSHYGVTHHGGRGREARLAEIVAPAHAPTWVLDRETLWNRVEAAEIRRDAQLAREIEVGLPVELSEGEGVALLRDYAKQEFTANGMVVDLSVARGRAHNPTGHLLLTLRRLEVDGFGLKERRWNGKSSLQEWRAAWAHCANAHLARAGHAVRIDHRTLEAQQIELIASPRVGIGRMRRTGGVRDGEPARAERVPLPPHLTQRMAEERRIARHNGDLIIEDPAVALRALTHARSTFSPEELARFLRSHSDGVEQFETAHRQVIASPELVAVESADGDVELTTRDLLDAHRSLLRRAAAMTGRRGHGVAPRGDASDDPALAELLRDGDLKTLPNLPPPADPRGRGRLLAAARGAWEAAGLRVTGGALSRHAALALQADTGIAAQTLEALETAWAGGLEALTRSDVLVVTQAELIGLKQLERVLAAADKARAKVVLCGELDRLPGGGTHTALHAIVNRAAGSEPAGERAATADAADC